jgi:hypothetical protein
MNQITDVKTPDSPYKELFVVGGIAAMLAGLLTLSEVIGFSFCPQPVTIQEWFLLFNRNLFIGLFSFWGLEVLMYLMFILVFLALYVVLRKYNEGRMMIALALALLGIAIFLATNNPVSMLSLSNLYATATTEVEKETILAAGQAVLTNTNQRVVDGFNMGLFLVAVAGLLVSSVMVVSKEFSNKTAFIGILANGLTLADYIREVLTSSPVIALLVILPNALFLIIWFLMVGRRLYRLQASLAE